MSITLAGGMSPGRNRIGKLLQRPFPAVAAHIVIERLNSRRGSTATIRRLTRSNNQSSRPVVGTAPAVVSLTSYGSRLAKVWMSIESIGMGVVRPSRLILWVDFGTDVRNLPPELDRLIARGLEVIPTRDLGSHKKYFPALSELAPDGPMSLVTADDDVLYPRSWLNGLIRDRRKHPDAVIGYRCRSVQLSEQGPGPFETWPLRFTSAPSPLTHPLGYSGVLYPPEMIGHLSAAGTGFIDTAPRADDVWLQSIAVRNGVPIKQVGWRPRAFPATPGTEESGLFLENLGHGGNDTAIASTFDAEILERLKGHVSETARS